MATNIQSTALDFENIKNNLKGYFQSKDEFRDYNFEASGLSNFLDVLAYNTHINGLITNFLLNEAYLNTSQLRSSTVSLANNLGYNARSVSASTAIVNLSTSASGLASTLTLPAFTKFTSEIAGETYTFQTTRQYTATNDGSNNYLFVDADGNPDISIYEGTIQVRNFTGINPENYPIYYISDNNMDTATALVRVYPQGSTSYTEYQNITELPQISTDSTFYVLREAPVGGYELYFGDGTLIGVAPGTLTKIEVTYVRPSDTGDLSNSASLFVPLNDPISWSSGGSSTLNVSTVSPASGGRSKESIDSIKQFAPLAFRAQNRMVTPEDYVSMILRNYGNNILDISAWGGEDNLNPEFGAVYISLNFSDIVNNNTRVAIRSGIRDLQDNFGVASFKVRFVDPEITYIKLNTEVQFSRLRTSDAASTVTTNVESAINTYFDTNINAEKFAQTFRRSKMLAYIDNNVSGILSSRSDVELGIDLNPAQFVIADTIYNLQDLSPPTRSGSNFFLQVAKVLAGAINEVAQFILPNSSSSYTDIVDALNTAARLKAKTLRYPGPLLEPDDNEYIITSTEFDYLASTKNIIRNKLNSTDLEVYNVTGNQVVGIYGSYNPSAGTVTINPTFVTNSSADGAAGGSFPASNIRIFAKPADQSFLVAQRNGLINYDTVNSTVTAVGSSLTR